MNVCCLNSETLQELLFVCPFFILELRFYRCCHPCFYHKYLKDINIPKSEVQKQNYELTNLTLLEIQLF